MENFNLLDGGVLLIVVVSGILAYSRGFIREGLAIAGWIIAAIAGFIFGERAVPLLAEIPFVDKIVNSSCELGIIAGFCVVFALALILVSVFTTVLSAVIDGTALSPFDRGAGFLFGIARGVLIVAVALLLYNAFIPDDARIELVETSRTKEILSGTTTTLEENVPDDAPNWLAQKFADLTQSCQG